MLKRTFLEDLTMGPIRVFTSNFRVFTSNYDIFKVRRKCEYLTHALLIARMKYHIVSFPWSDCTKAAIKNVNDYHATTEDEKGEVKRHCRITNHETLRKYYITFRKSLYFPNPYKCHKRRGVMAHVFQ